jgi:AmmeMemoRadiSam system protein A
VTVICDIAVDAIAIALDEGVRRLPDIGTFAAGEAWLTEPGASFVTLERDGRLLGCVGTLEAHQPLGRDIADHALAAAFDDPRLPPLTHDDFTAMSVKVSVLSASTVVPARSHDELRASVRPGVDGVIVSCGRSQATFLPSVWPKVPDVDDFLDALWLKAALRPRTWFPETMVRTYTTREWTDPGPRDTVGSLAARSR